MYPFPSLPRLIAPAALCGLLLLSAGTGWAQTTPTAEQRAEKARLLALARVDWQQMLTRLHLTLPTLPPEATDPNRPAGTKQRSGFSSWFDEAGRRYIRSSWGGWSNYDEARAGQTALPDPLVLRNCQPVRDARGWWQQRRPEILADITSQVYGQIPRHTPAVAFAITGTEVLPNGLGTSRTIVGTVDNRRYPTATPRLNLTLYLPTQATGPVPLIVVVGGMPPSEADQPSILEQVLGAGYALATTSPADVQADTGAGLNSGIIGLVNRGKSRQPTDWGTLAAWSWSLSRALDYFAADPAIDGQKVALQGHSRWGKTALLAAALDPRWALAYISCSGAMGASLEKRDFGETLGNVAEANEYHWMAGNFLRYAGRWDAMPTDAHELLALVAPRPVLLTGGTADTWTDARGTFLAGVGAGPVYELLGKKGLGTTIMPAPNVALLAGEIAFREHVGGHTDAPDWPVFLEYARKYFGPWTAAHGQAAPEQASPK